MTRLALAAVAVIIVWVLVLGGAAGVPWSAPLLPATRVALKGADFRPVIGAGVDDGTTLGVGATASDGNALQTIALDGLHASDLRILSYRFEDFPRTLELSLVFRRADAPNDVQVLLLPWPGDATRSVDLSAFPAWRGDIVELGFAEYATAQLVPPSIAFRPFRLLRASLGSPAWSTVPALLRTAWFDYQPWNLMSISALGPNINALQTPTMLLPVALGAFATIAVVGWLRGFSRARLLRISLLFAGLAWLAVDLRWLHDLYDKHRLSAAIYSGKSWQERAALQPDEDVAGFAELIRRQLSGVSPQRRILVTSDSTYTMLRLIYFLLPLNAAPLDAALAASAERTWPPGTIIVLCGASAWHFDEAQSTLNAGTRALAVDAVFVGGKLGIYRLREARG